MNDDADNEGGPPTGYPVPNVVAPLPDVRADSCRSPPIFLHASFRTGSTWLWQKMRAAPTTLAYYEIFNEVLEKLTPEHARRTDFSSWPSKHPISSPYFLEFLPFIRPEGGIPGFDHSMGVEGIIPPYGPDSDLPPSQHAHVDRLITAAWAQRRIPILSCTRTLGRARALKRAFGGQTIFLHRNLFHQWSSYCFLAENGNSFFVDEMCRAILASRHDPYLSGLVSWFELQQGSRAASETLFPIFVLLHLYLYSIAFDTADLIVDTTEIAADATVRRRVERQLSEMVGYPITLADARLGCEPTSSDFDCPQRMRDTIEQFAKLIPAASLSTEAVDFIDQAKDRALAEWDRCEFFTRRIRTDLARKIDDTAGRLEQQHAQNLRLQAEIERLNDERDALLQRLSASETAKDMAVAEATAAASRQESLEQALAKAEADRERSLSRRIRRHLTPKAWP